MAWNQPGSGGNKDPWGRGGGDRQGPPDLDEVIRNVQQKLGSLFGGRRGGGGTGSAGPANRGIFIGGLIVLLVGAWLASGLFVVNQGEAGVVLRFGKYVDTKDAGLRWHIPYPIESVDIVDMQKVNTVEVGYRSNLSNRQNTTVPREALMLTQDENIIDIQFAVQYDIKDPRELLFKVSEAPGDIVRQTTESAVREIVGRNSMDFVLTEGRSAVAAETKILLQQILDRYQSGINIRAVVMQNAQPPAEVKPAFDDAVKAREDEVRQENEAQAYANDIIPRARGAAARIQQGSEAYKEAVVAKAEGDSARFDKVLAAYQKAPDVTRERLYLESMQEVLGKSSKVVIDQKPGANNIIYLPLDQMLNKSRIRSVGSTGTAVPDRSSNVTAGTGPSSGRTGRIGRLSQ